MVNKSPKGRPLAAIGEKLNHVLARGRLIFCQSIADADSPTSTTDPIFRMLFPERNPHGTERVWVALFLPRTGAATAPAFGRSPGGPVQIAASSIVGTPASPADLRIATMVEPVIVGGRLRDLHAMVRNGFRLVHLCIYERSRLDGSLNGDLDVLNPASVAGGGPIRDRPLRRIRRGLEQAWHNQRNVACGSVVGNATTCRITGTTLTNIFDRASTARTASTPGVLIDELLGELIGTGGTVKASVAVYASVTGGNNGSVRFESSQGAITYTGIQVGTAQLYRLPTKVTLTTLTATRGANAATEKVDIFAAAGTGGESIDVFSWSICTDPDTA